MKKFYCAKCMVIQEEHEKCATCGHQVLFEIEIILHSQITKPFQ